MIIHKNRFGMMVPLHTRFGGLSLRELRDYTKVQIETIPKDQRQYFSQDEIRSSGVLEIIEEVFVELYQEYMGRPLSTDTSYKPFLEKEIYETAVSRILDRARSLDGVKGECSMGYESLIKSLRPYSTSIKTEEYSLFGTVSYIWMQRLLILVYADDSRVLIVDENGRAIHTYDDTSYLKCIILLDAASDLLIEKVQKLMLEIKAKLSAQDIYFSYAKVIADTMTGKFQGKTRISHKGNRTSLHFYLSDTEKAVITFFQEKMPWKMPEPPTDPESLRKTCQEEGSPFFIVSLSKKDRRILESYKNE